jgi:hypothetical protein
VRAIVLDLTDTAKALLIVWATICGVVGLVLAWAAVVGLLRRG